MSNESSEIIRDLNAGFNDFAKNPDLDLYPEAGVAAVCRWWQKSKKKTGYRFG